MKKILSLCIAILMVFSIAGCSSEGHEGQAKTPSGSSVQHGRDYQEVYEQFEKKGFTNIKFEVLDDLVTGWLTKDGEVESVSVDGYTGYSADKWYPADVEVIITYHTFPNKESGNDASDNSEITEPTTDEPIVEPIDDILTVENCEALATILTINADMDDSYADFATNYKNRIIEFDGCIIYLTNHDDYDTRYDLLLNAGDYVDENTANSGPTFKFKNVGVYDLGDGLTLADFVKVGSNVTIRAKVKNYNPDTGLFEIDPVLIEAR